MTAFFDLTIDMDRREVTRRGAAVPLTRTELDLLAALAEQPGRVWTREQIGERVFGESFDTFDRTIDSHVKNLRAKLGTRPDGGTYVETVRGIGYRAARPSDVALDGEPGHEPALADRPWVRPGRPRDGGAGGAGGTADRQPGLRRAG